MLSAQDRARAIVEESPGRSTRLKDYRSWLFLGFARVREGSPFCLLRRGHRVGLDIPDYSGDWRQNRSRSVCMDAKYRAHSRLQTLACGANDLSIAFPNVLIARPEKPFSRTLDAASGHHCCTGEVARNKSPQWSRGLVGFTASAVFRRHYPVWSLDHPSDRGGASIHLQ